MSDNILLMLVAFVFGTLFGAGLIAIYARRQINKARADWLAANSTLNNGRNKMKTWPHRVEEMKIATPRDRRRN